MTYLHSRVCNYDSVHFKTCFSSVCYFLEPHSSRGDDRDTWRRHVHRLWSWLTPVDMSDLQRHVCFWRTHVSSLGLTWNYPITALLAWNAELPAAHRPAKQARAGRVPAGLTRWIKGLLQTPQRRGGLLRPRVFISFESRLNEVCFTMS